MTSEPYQPREIVLFNAAECSYCGKVLWSHYRHDYRTHSCPQAPGHGFMVDGGLAYIRRGWNFTGDFIERSLVIQTRIYDGCLRGLA